MSWPFVQARYDYGRRTAPVLGFVVHMAEGGGTVGYLARSPARGVSVHYVVESSGRVVQMLLESHASGSINPNDIRTTDDAVLYGISSARAVLGSHVTDPNSAVISVELEGFAREGPNDPQVIGLQALLADVRRRYPRIGLLGHRDFQDVKPCPGRLIPWPLLGGHAVDMHNRTVTILPFGGTFTIAAGTTPTAIKLDQAGNVTARRTWPGATAPSTGHFDATVVDDAVRGNPFLRVTDGFFEGFLLSTAGVAEAPNPAPPAGDCSAQLAALRAAILAAIEAVPTS